MFQLSGLHGKPQLSPSLKPFKPEKKLIARNPRRGLKPKPLTGLLGVPYYNYYSSY